MTITTNLAHTHQYNPVGPVAYLITFRTYGTWLHGDERGWVDRKGHNIPGTPVLMPDPRLEQAHRTRLQHEPVTFNPSQRALVDKTIREVIAHNKWLLHAVNVRTEHLHVVLSANNKPERVMNSLKSWCTRRLREGGLLDESIYPWARHGSTRYLWNEEDVRGAVAYVLDQ